MDVASRTSLMKKMMTSCVLTVILTLSYTCGQNIFKRVQRRSMFDGKTCKSSDLLFSTDGTSLVKCLAMCGQNQNCRSIFHKPSTRGCFGCNAVYSSFTTLIDGNNPVETGTLYYIQFAKHGGVCSGSMPCGEDNSMCTNGICICHHNANYNPSSGKCTSGCSQYGTTYQMYHEKRLREHDRYVRKGSLNECLDLCSTDRDNNGNYYTCHGIDYNSNTRRCKFNQVSIRDYPNAWEDGILDIDSYVRNCK